MKTPPQQLEELAEHTAIYGAPRAKARGTRVTPTRP